jgi:hypothetical protein
MGPDMEGTEGTKGGLRGGVLNIDAQSTQGYAMTISGTVPPSLIQACMSAAMAASGSLPPSLARDRVQEILNVDASLSMRAKDDDEDRRPEENEGGRV